MRSFVVAVGEKDDNSMKFPTNLLSCTKQGSFAQLGKRK